MNGDSYPMIQVEYKQPPQHDLMSHYEYIERATPTPPVQKISTTDKMRAAFQDRKDGLITSDELIDVIENLLRS